MEAGRTPGSLIRRCGQAGAGGPLGTLQLDDADEPRLQVVVIAGVAQV